MKNKSAAQTAELLLPPALRTIDFERKKPDIARRASAYVRVLKSYTEHNQYTEAELRAAYGDTDGDQLRHLIHGLKGAAGNLAMMPLYELAAEQETWLREGGEIHQAVFDELLKLLRDSLHDAQAIVDLNEQTERSEQQAQLRPAVQELARYLARSEVPSAELLMSLRQLEQSSSGNKQLALLLQAVVRYDYDEALLLLSELE
ncbi:Hpt domain-containing protein [Agaribacterium haliotis]|uniref:Hpt domain-containing protein n=1 Tax=Agaribacterium haliotis TaxID=2013869 RepID=UPI0011774B9A|nr:Hpt domain-containing protein [Agaribacterium haliotis]